jgi:hypothetical protein
MSGAAHARSPGHRLAGEPHQGAGVSSGAAPEPPMGLRLVPIVWAKGRDHQPWGGGHVMLTERWTRAVAVKPPGHGINDPGFPQPSRPMSAIGG